MRRIVKSWHFSVLCNVADDICYSYILRVMVGPFDPLDNDRVKVQPLLQCVCGSETYRYRVVEIYI